MPFASLDRKKPEQVQS